MATNLRLDPETEAAVRAESKRTGVSQQQIMRQAIREHVGLEPRARTEKELPDWVIPASEPYRRIEPWITLREGETVMDLLDREDRL